MRRRSLDAGEFGLQIAPMLDILFVLLLFFMVAAGIQKRETAIAMQLPGGPGGEVPVNISIDPDGQVNLNNAPVDTLSDDRMVQMIGRLKAIMASNPKQPVLIRPAASTRQQRVVDVINACQAAHVKNLAFGDISS